jgi:alkanesulfonate monooxygenase SsuD/methylene tetrahydromethanopterin reductase-like flavin-dependent oxidoreductase (luciferase family)
VKDRVAAMKQLWTQEGASYQGEFARFPPVRSEPKPLQRPHPPIHLGGNHPHSFRRVGEWGDGWIPLRLSAEEVRNGRQKIAEHARAAGRDASRIEVSVFGGAPDRETLQGHEDAGTDRWVVFVPSHGSVEMERELASLARQLGIG